MLVWRKQPAAAAATKKPGLIETTHRPSFYFFVHPNLAHRTETSYIFNARTNHHCCYLTFHPLRSSDGFLFRGQASKVRYSSTGRFCPEPSTCPSHTQCFLLCAGSSVPSRAHRASSECKIYANLARGVAWPPAYATLRLLPRDYDS